MNDCYVAFSRTVRDVWKCNRVSETMGNHGITFGILVRKKNLSETE
jgi:hypothetical protein